MEQVVGNGALAEEESKRLDKVCRIHVHHKTKRLADSDGRSCKAVIDGIVLAGLLRDDSPRFVKEVSQSQEKSKLEETIIDIIWD